MSGSDLIGVPRDILAAACYCVRQYAPDSETYKRISALSLGHPNASVYATQIAALPIIQQIEIMQEVATGKAWGDLAQVFTSLLDSTLDCLHRDAIDQAAAENDALHGQEVSVLGAPGSSPCGMLVGF